MKIKQNMTSLSLLAGRTVEMLTLKHHLQQISDVDHLKLCAICHNRTVT